MKYIIYRITTGDYTYIGSTVDLKQRKKTHKCDCNKEGGANYNLRIYQMIRETGGWDKCEMVPIEEFECENRTYALIREEHWRREYNANMNSMRAYTTEEEAKANHKARQKKYRESNKEIINAKQNQQYTCACGGNYQHSHKSKHERTKKHIKYLEEQNLDIV
jgi:hypothetical protein